MAHGFLNHPYPIPFAHRGGAGEGPENAVAAFENVVRLGYRYIETDVRATSDGIVVAVHDADLRRLYGQSLRVDELTWGDLTRVTTSAGGGVIRLDEALGAWPSVRFNVDVKADDALGPVTEVIRKCNAIDRVCVASFSDSRLARIRVALGPELCTALGPREVRRLILASGLGHRGKPFDGAAAQIPPRFHRLPVASPRVVRYSLGIHLPVHVWTIDSAAQIGALLDLGVNGIMTDQPAVLKQVLVARGQWYGNDEL